LKRRTDLYHVLQGDSCTTGFAPGKAEALVLDAFRRQQTSDTHLHAPFKTHAVPNISVSGGSGISTWNGGSTDKYRWSQSQAELTVEIHLPSPVTSSKEIQVHLGSNRLQVGTTRNGVTVSGDLDEAINVSESSWTLEDKQRVVLFIVKKTSGWWKSVLKGDPEIDRTKVDSRVKIEDLPEETQSAVQKILLENGSQMRGS
jgi:hypothetical protein